MAKEDVISMQGVVTEVLPSAMFRIKLPNDHIILSTIGGKIRKNHINILLGDRVDIEMSPYDLTRGRIVYRHK